MNKKATWAQRQVIPYIVEIAGLCTSICNIKNGKALYDANSLRQNFYASKQPCSFFHETITRFSVTEKP